MRQPVRQIIYAVTQRKGNLVYVIQINGLIRICGWNEKLCCRKELFFQNFHLILLLEVLNSNVIENITSCVNIKKRNFRQTILDNLHQLRDTDPKKYWKLIKSLKEESDSTHSVEPEQWFQYFTELNQQPSSIESKLNYINSKVKDMENMKINCEFDFLISSKEISDGISTLKSGKG